MLSRQVSQLPPARRSCCTSLLLFPRFRNRPCWGEQPLLGLGRGARLPAAPRSCLDFSPTSAVLTWQREGKGTTCMRLPSSCCSSCCPSLFPCWRGDAHHTRVQPISVKGAFFKSLSSCLLCGGPCVAEPGLDTASATMVVHELDWWQHPDWPIDEVILMKVGDVHVNQ